KRKNRSSPRSSLMFWRSVSQAISNWVAGLPMWRSRGRRSRQRLTSSSISVRSRSDMRTTRFARRHHPKDETKSAESFLVPGCGLVVEADDGALAFGQPGWECLRTSPGLVWPTNRDRRSPTRTAPRSPQSRNFRVSPQLPLDIVTAGPEDNAGGAPGLEQGETFAQLPARARERHLFGVGHVDERVMAV